MSIIKAQEPYTNLTKDSFDEIKNFNKNKENSLITVIKDNNINQEENIYLTLNDYELLDNLGLQKKIMNNVKNIKNRKYDYIVYLDALIDFYSFQKINEKQKKQKKQEMINEKRNENILTEFNSLKKSFEKDFGEHDTLILEKIKENMLNHKKKLSKTKDYSDMIFLQEEYTKKQAVLFKKFEKLPKEFMLKKFQVCGENGIEIRNMLKSMNLEKENIYFINYALKVRNYESNIGGHDLTLILHVKEKELKWFLINSLYFDFGGIILSKKRIEKIFKIPENKNEEYSQKKLRLQK